MIKLLLMAGGAYLLYKYSVAPQTGSTSVSPFSRPSANSKVGAQPSEQYPLQAIVAPRVDNSNQPWYAGSRSFNNTPDQNLVDSNFAANVQTVGAVADLSDSLNTLWDNFQGAFASTDTVDNSMNTFDWNDVKDTNNYWNA